MSSATSATTMHRATSLSDALEQLAGSPDLTVLAGGTDLMVYVQLGSQQPDAVLDIWPLDELRGVTEDGDHLVIGALTSFAAIGADPLVREHLPALVEAAGTVGALPIQNRATIGGNLINASPAADSPPTLLAADAELTLARWVDGAVQARTVPLAAFYRGYKDLDLQPGELLTQVRVKKCGLADRDLFVKVGTRQAQAISKVVLGARATLNDDGTIGSARIALGSVGPTTARLRQTEALLTGRVPDAALVEEARRSAAAEVTPIDDIRSRAEYRRAVSGNLVARFVRSLQ